MYSEAKDFEEKNRFITELKHELSKLRGSRSDPFKTDQYILEVGGAGGLLAGMLSNYEAKVIASDIINKNSIHRGIFYKLLDDKFKRNGHILNLNNFEYHVVDAQNLIYKDNLFSLVVSLNSFEHIMNPELAITEIHRVLKKDGIVFLKFDPVWTADSGNHFMQYVKEPWAHLIYSDEQISEMMKRNGATEVEISSYLHEMNRLPVDYYLQLFDGFCKKIFNCSSYYYWSGCVTDDFKNHKNLFEASGKLNVQPEKLLIRGFSFIGIK